MFVPSLSWQNDHFSHKLAQKDAVFVAPFSDEASIICQDGLGTNVNKIDSKRETFPQSMG